MATDEHKALLRRYWQEASARGVLAVIDDYFAADMVAHPPASASPTPIRGRDAWKRFTRGQWGAFPDLTGTVEEVLAEGDRVALRVTARGTHSGPLLGLPPTGKPVTFAGMEFFRLQAGRIVESWGHFDAVSLLQQLGVLPGPGQAPATVPGEPGPLREDPPPPASAEETRAVVRRYVDELLNGHRLERAGDILAPDFVGYFPGTPAPVRGVDGWRQHFGGFLAAFPDYAETPEDLIVEDGAAAARITFGGTHRGDLMGIPPTGRTIEVGGMAILHVRAGQLAAQWAAADLLGLLHQLGGMPAPGPATG
jgi:steroid delta-isomerase-like uncharacterized protein